MILATFVLYLADQQNQTDDAQRMLNDFKVTMLNDFKVTCSADNMILLLFYILLYIATVVEIFNQVLYDYCYKIFYLCFLNL